jgi:hypothetical protein
MSTESGDQPVGSPSILVVINDCVYLYDDEKTLKTHVRYHCNEISQEMIELPLKEFCATLIHNFPDEFQHFHIGGIPVGNKPCKECKFLTNRLNNGFCMLCRFERPK